MQTTPSHLTDEELLLVADREASPRDTAKAREHLSQCAPCRERMGRLEQTLTDFISLHEATHSSSMLPPDSRAALKSRLADAARSTSVPSWFPIGVMPGQVAAACFAMLIVAASVWGMRNIASRQQRGRSSDMVASALPQRRLTPGVAHTVRIEDLCSAQGIENDPAVDPSLEQAVFKEYGLQGTAQNSYEIDFLITPALGGAEDIHNLWPQPYTSTWNSRTKDQLENHLHELVCQGKVQLSTAQGEIATDWISAYKRYFNTDKPQPSTRAISKRLNRMNVADLMISDTLAKSATDRD